MDLPVPVWKINAEHDVWFGEANVLWTGKH
jgi:hypothetical protein